MIFRKIKSLMAIVILFLILEATFCFNRLTFQAYAVTPKEQLIELKNLFESYVILFNQSRYKELLINFKEMLIEYYGVDQDEANSIPLDMEEDDYQEMVLAAENLTHLIEKNREIIAKSFFKEEKIDKADEINLIDGLKYSLKLVLAKCYENLEEYDMALQIYRDLKSYYEKELEIPIKSREEIIEELSEGKKVPVITDESRENLKAGIIEIDNAIESILEKQKE